MRTLSHQEASRTYDRIGSLQDSQGFYEDRATALVVQHGNFTRAGAISSDNAREATTVVGWLPGTDVEAALSEMREAEKMADKTRGWTWNFGHPLVLPAIFLAVVIFPAPPIIAWWLGIQSQAFLLLLIGAGLCVLLIGAHRLSRDPSQ